MLLVLIIMNVILPEKSGFPDLKKKVHPGSPLRGLAYPQNFLLFRDLLCPARTF